jgi:nitroimidazol reductase NimA-like FMN-containing flavoprotein (pyridoxamine 5'-phosphate oxidase superfamily)
MGLSALPVRAERRATLVLMSARLFTLTRDECMYLLRTVPVGRVALTMDALPVVLPVHFSLLDDDVVFQTVEGTRFHAASSGAVLAFEADGYASDGASGWSVLIQGRSQLITDGSELDQIHWTFVNRWASEGNAERAVRIRSCLVSGRRFERH